MKLIIYTAYPCLVKLENKFQNINQNEHIEIEYQGQDIIIKPDKNHGQSFLIDIENESPVYRVIKKENKILVFLLDGLMAENIQCYEFDNNPIKSSVEVGTKQLVFFGAGHKKVIHLNLPIKDIKVGSFSFINYLCFDDGNQKTLIAYNPKKNAAKTFSANEIEIGNDGFSITKHDFNYEKIKLEYYVDNEGLKLKNKDFNALNLASPSQTIPYKFMTAIKFGDYQTALSFLSAPLAQKLSQAAIKEYFGEISYFYMLDSSSCFAISNGNNIIYDFSLSSDKISDIQQS